MKKSRFIMSFYYDPLMSIGNRSFIHEGDYRGGR